MQIEVGKIGFVENDVKKSTDGKWSTIKSKIVLDSYYKGGLKGLESFSHAVILTYLHKANYSSKKHLTKHPRNQESLPCVGVFSQRAKDRPNPIGMTTVKIIGVCDGHLEVEGLDAINGTPVLDIKPYYPHYDRVDNSSQPEWVDQLSDGSF